MDKVDTLRKKMEDAYVNGKPDALKLSQKLDKLIVEEQRRKGIKNGKS